MALKIKNDTLSNISSNWVAPPKDYYTQDDVIDAYLKGKEEQKILTEKVLIEKLDSNLNQAKNLVEQITEKIINDGFTVFKSYLLLKDIFKFDAIIDVELSDYISDEFDKIYKYSRDVKNEVNGNTFYISFSFMPHTDELNENTIACDGFLFTYQKSE